MMMKLFNQADTPHRRLHAAVSPSRSSLGVLVAALALSSSAGWSQALAQTSPMPDLGSPVCATDETIETASPLTFAPGKTSSGWIAFDYYAGNRIFIPVTVNGREVMAMLDSGASSSVLDSAFVVEAGLLSVGEHAGEAVGGSTTYGVVDGVEIRIGDLTWANGSAVGIDLAAVSTQLGRPTPVILGGEMFTGAVVEIDFANRRIAFHDPATYAPPADAVSAALKPVFENRSIAVEIDGRRAEMLFDLGNGGTVTLFPRFWERDAFLEGKRRSTTFAGGAGGMSEMEIVRLETVGLGGVVLLDAPARLSSGDTAADDRDLPLDGNLGMGVLSRFHLTVDFPHDRVLFAQPVDQGPFRINRAGLTLRPDAAGPMVLHVARGSPTARAGLKGGDVIVAVEGVESAELSQGGWQSGPVGETVRLRLVDQREIALTLADYF